VNGTMAIGSCKTRDGFLWPTTGGFIGGRVTPAARKVSGGLGSGYGLPASVMEGVLVQQRVRAEMMRCRAVLRCLVGVPVWVAGSVERSWRRRSSSSSCFPIPGLAMRRRAPATTGPSSLLLPPSSPLGVVAAEEGRSTRGS
jgi:hypothetical protein